METGAGEGVDFQGLCGPTVEFVDVDVLEIDAEEDARDALERVSA
jgi:hypothetical protein